MKIAYFIMAHQKPAMLLRMMNAIFSEENLYLIHIDSGADDALFALANDLANANSNIKLLPSRYLMWGGWSLVQVELDAIRFMLNWNHEWDYYVNLSGQDFPLVSQPKIRDILKSQDKNFLQIVDNPEAIIHNQKYYIVEDAGEMKILGERKPFEQYFSAHIKPYYGSQWKLITREFAEYAASSYMSFEMQDYFRYTLVPDEQFFQTLIMNGPFASTVVNKNMRCIRLKQDDSGAVSHADVFTMADLSALYNHEGLFARKFDQDIDSEVLFVIEKMIGIS